MQYNELGQEIEIILPGDAISKWQYNATGRPTHHRISSRNRHTRRRVYDWDVNHRLRRMVNELTGIQVTYGSPRTIVASYQQRGTHDVKSVYL